MQTSAAVRIDYLPSESERTAALFEYLRTMREVAEAQRQVMLRYLGEDARLAVSPHATKDGNHPGTQPCHLRSRPLCPLG